MHTMTNRIVEIDDAHIRRTLNVFRLLGNYQRIGLITVTLYPEDVPEDGNYVNVIVSTPDGHVMIQDGILEVIIDGYHLHAATVEL